MKKNITKILAGLETTIYSIFAILILLIASQNKYISINSWTGLLLWGGLGILCPLLASIVANVFIRREKQAVGKVVSYLLIPYAAFSCISLFFFQFGGIICSGTENISNYREYDAEAEPILQGYENLFPAKEETGIQIEEYSYKYVKTFDDNCELYVKTKYEDVQQLEDKLNFFEEKLGMKTENSKSDSGSYEYGECMVCYDKSKLQIEYTLK